MKGKPEISDAEYQVMKVIWAAGTPISTNEVVERLKTYTAWKPKTIHTLLSRLVKKNALQYEKDGRVFVYTPLVKESEILSVENDNFLNRFYDGALNAMVVNLLEQDKLSDDDIATLKHILDEKISDGSQAELAARSSRLQTRAGHVVSDQGRLQTRAGHVVSDQGRLQTRAGHVVSDQGNLESR